MGKLCLHASLFIFDRIIIKVAGNQDRHKSLVEFHFRPNHTTQFGITCPWVTKISHFWTWISLKQVGHSWSNFMSSIIGVRERLHKVFGANWPWYIGLRWAVVALWATCFRNQFESIFFSMVRNGLVMCVRLVGVTTVWWHVLGSHVWLLSVVRMTVSLCCQDPVVLYAYQVS